MASHQILDIDEGEFCCDVTRGLTAEQELLGAVIALALSDCKRTLKAPAWSSLTTRQVIEAASAARFLLSQDGKAMLLAFGQGRGGGMERHGMLMGVAIGRATLERLNLSEEGVLDGPNSQWENVVIWADTTTWTEVTTHRRFEWPHELQKMRGEQTSFCFVA